MPVNTLDARIAYFGDAAELQRRLRPMGVVLRLDRCEASSVRTMFFVDPARVLAFRGREGRLVESSGKVRSVEDPFSTIDLLLGALRPAPADAPDCVGGLVGFLGYELLSHVEPIPADLPGESALPDLWLGDFPLVVVFDPRKEPGVVRLFGLDDDAPTRRRAEAVRRCLELPLPSPPKPPLEEASARPAISSMGRQRWLRRVEEIREAIRDGSVYQVNLTQRFLVRVPGEAAVIYQRLLDRHPARYAAHLALEGGDILSLSPELFLEIRDREVITRPIKGTLPRGKAPAEDERQAAALLASAKDRAELAMIVDLMRNDLSKVARTGSMKVVSHAALESVPTVHHLVSTVRAVLDDGKTLGDLLRATFPGGSVTGAPKVAAMEYIREMETLRRGPYTGAIGFLGRDGRARLNLAIRTLVLDSELARIHAGCGIVADSDPIAEWREAVAKVEGLLEILGGDAPCNPDKC